MKIILDGKECFIEDCSKTIVEIAKANGIFISAPCFYRKQEHICCNGCLILVDGKEARACETTPVDGMNIIYDREDLMTLRSRNLTKYAAQKEIAEKINADKEKKGCCGGGSCGDSCSC